MTLSQGVTPSVCTIVIPAGTSIPHEYGTLTFTFGGQVIASFPDAKVVDTSVTVGPSGQVQVLVIHDRRWKWQFGGVAGVINQRWPDGTINIYTLASPHWMFGYLLEALGETEETYNVDLVGDPKVASPVDENGQPNGNGQFAGGFTNSHKDQHYVEGVRPEQHWSWTEPANALNALCDFFSCRFVLGLYNKVRVVPLGVGAMLPDGAMLEDAVVFNPPEEPEKIWFIGGPTRYQHDFGLTPVGRDLSGKIRAIDDLSYRPSCGWEREAQPNFTNVLKEHGYEAWQWAKRCVWRWYRVWGNYDLSQPIRIPGYGELEDGWQIVPIENEQVQTWSDLQGLQIQKPFAGGVGLGLKDAPILDTKKSLTEGIAKGLNFFASSENVQAQVFGVRRTMNQDFKNTRQETLYIGAFTIERDLAIVMFHDHVLKNVDGLRKPAELYLRCAVSVRDPYTREWIRYFEERPQGKVKTPPQVLFHDEVVLSYINGKPVNLEECERDAAAYLDAAAREYKVTTPQSRTYEGLLPIYLDGAIQQIQWHVGEPYAYTKVSRNNEFSTVVPGYAERRKHRRIAEKRANADWANEQFAKSIKENRNPFEPGR